MSKKLGWAVFALAAVVMMVSESEALAGRHHGRRGCGGGGCGGGGCGAVSACDSGCGAPAGCDGCAVEAPSDAPPAAAPPAPAAPAPAASNAAPAPVVQQATPASNNTYVPQMRRRGLFRR